LKVEDIKAKGETDRGGTTIDVLYRTCSF